MIRHDSFSLERHFDVRVEDAWRLFADEATWRRWFRMPGSRATYAHDFRVGGADTASAEFRMPGGRVERLAYRATYLVIDPGRLVTHAYTATVDGIPRWSALVTARFQPSDGGTSLSWTEQVALGHASDESGDQDLAHLRGGVQLRLTAMRLALDEGVAAAPGAR